MLTSLFLVVISLVSLSLLVFTKKITGAYFAYEGTAASSIGKWSLLFLIIIPLIYFFIIKRAASEKTEEAADDFNRIKKELVQHIKNKEHEKAFEHYEKLKEEYEKKFR